MAVELPLGWAWAPLEQLCEPAAPIVYGIILPGEDDPQGVPYLRPIDVLENGEVDLSSVKRTAPGIAAKYARASIRTGDLVLSIVGTIGKVCSVPVQLDGGNITQSSVRVRVAKHISSAYVRYALLSPQLRQQYDRYRFGNAVQRLNVAHARELRVPVASRAEQNRIVTVLEQHLSDIDAGVTALERALLNLKRYRASVLKAACEGKLVPTEAELARKEGRSYEAAGVLLERILRERRERWEATRKTKYKPPVGSNSAELPELPEGWVWTTVEAVGDVLLGRQRAPQYLTGRWTHPYLRVANIKDDRIDFDDVENMDFDPEHFEKYRLEPDDILVSEGQSPDRVGESAIYQGGIEGLCFQKTLHRFRPVPSGPPAKYAQIVFRAHVKTGVFQKMASITTNIAHLTLEKFEAAPFPLPPVAEQHRIVAEVDRLLSVADETEAAVRAQLARAERLRQAVLKRAFEGKLVPQDPSDEPASVMLERIRAERAVALSTGGAAKRGRRKGAPIAAEEG